MGRGYARAAMDARTRKHADVEHDDAAEEARMLAETITAKRDRLLASLTLIAGIGVVVAIALVPLLEWFERRGVPSRIASGLCVLIFLAMAIFAIGSIVVPATDWVAQVPTKITKVRAALEPVLDLYKNLDRFIERTTAQIAVTTERTRAQSIGGSPSRMRRLRTSLRARFTSRTARMNSS